MVKQINFHVDDDVFDKADQVKEDQDLTWPEFLEKAADELEKECAVCGSEENIHSHHIDGDRDNNSPDNLITLCASCHREVHSDSQLSHLKDDRIHELKQKLPSVDPKTVTCDHCGYEWETESVVDRVTCPNCSRKTPNTAETQAEA
ncbi:HNH endonuclease signature motif containing protein [Haloferax sp. Q22]|uniref:HNH endonuclease signature motif containing protein n=1 Tax=Haloferax sp. (strain Q22) TaxID=1526048 RepID=UPI000A55DCD9|nr:HNH endonuclease signature motif containing protein [Haloferax sp. Q22]